jgi:hypothetical protein
MDGMPQVKIDLYLVFNINDGLIPPVVTRAFMIGTIIIFSIQVLFSFSIKIII